MPIRFLWRNLKTRWYDQRTELEALLQGLQPGDLAIDVGSNKGGYLLPLCRHAQQVLAIEPQADLADYLERMARIWRVKNLRVVAAAASDRRGEAPLWIPRDQPNSPLASLESRESGADPHRQVQVPLVRLDDLAQEISGRIGALKIDVEGHERAVLAGATELLATHRPVVICESEERHLASGSVRDLITWMEARGYDSQFVHRRQLLSAADFDPVIHQRVTEGEYWFDPSYANNFVFVPREGVAVTMA